MAKIIRLWVAKAKRFVYKLALMETMQFNFVTPETTFFSGPAAMVQAPGTLGDFGVLPGHMNFISTLRPGVVSIHDAQNQITRVFVLSGIAEVNPKSCTILAEKVIDLNTINRAEAEARLAKARATLDSAASEEAKKEASHEMEIAEALILAIGI